MTGTAATYYDGRSSTSRAVTLRVADGLLHVDGGDISTALRLDLVRLEPRLGELPRRLDLPNGASCQVPAEFELPTPADAPARVERWGNEAEIRWVPALVATVLVVAGLWASIVYGVPAAANIVARRISPSVERGMGSQALATLDRAAFTPSKLPDARRAALTGLRAPGPLNHAPKSTALPDQWSANFACRACSISLSNTARCASSSL